MAKLKHMDFMLYEDDDKRIKFRFYPRHSHMHSFDEEPPKTYKDVYKVYYSWGIMVSTNNSWDNKPKWTPYHMVFLMNCDECSAITELSYIIKEVIKNKTEYKQVVTFGQPGSDWLLHYYEAYIFNEDEQSHNEFLEIHVFNNIKDKGFRFYMPIQKSYEFCSYLDKVNEHMLENGEPI